MTKHEVEVQERAVSLAVQFASAIQWEADKLGTTGERLANEVAQQIQGEFKEQGE